MPEPRATRPRFHPVYGIHPSDDGLLPWLWARERLEAARNYWVVTTRADGRPHAMPVWGLWVDERVVFGTHPDSAKGRDLARDPRVVVHLESGDEVVILEGVAESARLDDRMADAYGAKYDFRPDPERRSEGWFAVPPRRAYAACGLRPLALAKLRFAQHLVLGSSGSRRSERYARQGFPAVSLRSSRDYPRTATRFEFA